MGRHTVNTEPLRPTGPRQWFHIGAVVACAAVLALTSAALTPSKGQASNGAGVDKILADNCTKCHGGKRKAAGLDLTDGRTAVVNKKSSQADGMVLIKPGDPGNSYLYLKVTGNHSDVGKGGQMPLGRGALSASELKTIKKWIAAGAR